MQRLLPEVLAKVLKPARHRTIQNFVANSNDKPAENGRVNPKGDSLRADFGKHIFLDGFLLILVEWKGARDLSGFTFEAAVFENDNSA
jgi:hypothetical protein